VIGRGIVAFHAGDLDKADKCFAAAHELKDERPELLLYEGLAAALRGKAPAAQALLERAAAGDRDPAAAAGSAGEGDAIVRAEAGLAIGLCLEIAGRPAEAIAKYLEAATAPAPVAGLAALVRSQAHAARGESPLAEEALREAARRGYDFPLIAAEIARARREVRDFATAVRFARYAEARRPGDAAILAGLGRSYLGAGQADDAEAAFDAALAASPEQVDALLGKARILWARGEYADAEALFHRARDVDADSAYAALALRRLDEARERRVWRDDFRRADGQDVRNRWDEEERFGVVAAIRGKRLVFSGRQASEDMGVAQVRREVEGARLAEFRVRLDATGVDHGRAGIRLRLRDGAEVAFFRAPDGQLAYSTHAPGKDWAEPVRAGAWPREAGPHELWFAVGGPDRGELVFGVDQDEAARAKLPAFGKTTAFGCAIYVQAPIGAAVDLAVSEAKVFIAREKRAGKSGGY
jgi:tetratricopeptide (TPR) repeat protein